MKKLKDIIFVFDVDSTLIKGESLEEIIEIASSNFVNRENIVKDIQKITKLGMEGKINFKESLKRRLGKAQILQEHLDLYNGTILLEQIDNNFRQIIKTIERDKGIAVIISGGFMDNIKIVAEKLGIDKNNCFANKFIKNGNKIIGFDNSNPLCESNGKVEIAKKIKKDNINKKVICIGDGNSDYLIKKEGVADEFWGFWANVKRKNLEDKADRNFYSSKQLFDFIKSI